jgi:hypothetical protein
LRKQWVVRDLGQIFNFDTVRVPLAAGCTCSNKVRTLLKRPGGHGGFCAHLVTGIEYRQGHVIAQLNSGNLRPVVSVYEFVYSMNLAQRVDQRDALAHGIAAVFRDAGPNLDGGLPPIEAYLPAAEELLQHYVNNDLSERPTPIP